MPLPSGSATPTSSAPASSPATPEEAIRAAYTAFWPNGRQALTGAFEQIEPTLARYATGDYLKFQVKNARMAKANGREPWGSGPVLHIGKIEIVGSAATLKDCQDARQAGLADASTKKLIPNTRGGPKQGFRAELQRGSDGQWRLSGLKPDRSACSGQ
ncbi:hypothetical protein [Actinomadura sp. 6N118]|uniref:hypothetical protein n=1 Tax=Actinomadura sp. 6N118 TaxID=3375151 RepID=UPI0037993A5F